MCPVAVVLYAVMVFFLGGIFLNNTQVHFLFVILLTQINI